MSFLKKSLLGLALSGLLPPAAHAQINLNSGLLGRFPFDGNLNDATGNMGASSGTNVAYAADAHGQPNAALRLTANGTAAIQPNGLLDFGTTGDFSFSVAFRSLASATQVFFTNQGRHRTYNLSQGWSLGFNNLRVGKVYLSLLQDVPATGPASAYSSSLGLATQQSYNDGQWHTAVATVNRATQQVRVYVDGVAQPLTYVCTNPSYGTVAGTVFQYGPELVANMDLGPAGNTANAFGTNLNGSLDEARFYNRVLSAAEVQALHAQVLASAPAVAMSGTEVFPNPALDGTVHLRLPVGLPTADLTVVTALGQVVRPAIVRLSAQELQLGGLLPGLYAVRLGQAGSSRVCRFEVR